MPYVSSSDRLDNVEDMKTMNKPFIARYTVETKEILEYLQANRKNITPTHRIDRTDL